MPNIDAFALPHSDLNRFLFADIGVEAGGNALSVLSAFARLGIDPWEESGRLAKLPQDIAIATLAKLLAILPGSALFLSDATATAARLVVLLPANGGLSRTNRRRLNYRHF